MQESFKPLKVLCSLPANLSRCCVLSSLGSGLAPPRETMKVHEPYSRDSGAEAQCPGGGYRGTSFIRNTPLLGPYSKTLPRVLRWSKGAGRFLMSEVPM